MGRRGSDPHHRSRDRVARQGLHDLRGDRLPRSVGEATGTTDEATIISVAELLCLLCLAAVRFKGWKGRL
eukprot:1212075-Heterocapsa_arctica.AAC.1